MTAGYYLHLPPNDALRWFKVLAVFRCAASRGEPPGFELPPDRLPLRVGEVHGQSSILIVDDQDLLREALGEYLAMQGYEVQLAASGVEGMKLLEQGLRPDLLLCDVMLPDISGAGFVREAQMLVPDLKILFMSGHTHETLISQIGGADFVQKPFRLDLLARRVRNRLASFDAEPQ
jgi:DNA-binding NtrC family response regulator